MEFVGVIFWICCLIFSIQTIVRCNKFLKTKDITLYENAKKAATKATAFFILECIQFFFLIIMLLILLSGVISGMDAFASDEDTGYFILGAVFLFIVNTTGFIVGIFALVISSRAKKLYVELGGQAALIKALQQKAAKKGTNAVNNGQFGQTILSALENTGKFVENATEPESNQSGYQPIYSDPAQLRSMTDDQSPFEAPPEINQTYMPNRYVPPQSNNPQSVNNQYYGNPANQGYSQYNGNTANPTNQSYSHNNGNTANPTNQGFSQNNRNTANSTQSLSQNNGNAANQSSQRVVGVPKTSADTIKTISDTVPAAAVPIAAEQKKHYVSQMPDVPLYTPSDSSKKATESIYASSAHTCANTPSITSNESDSFGVTRSTTIHCPHCGVSNKAEDKFCTFCGKSLT